MKEGLLSNRLFGKYLSFFLIGLLGWNYLALNFFIADPIVINTFRVFTFTFLIIGILINFKVGGGGIFLLIFCIFSFAVSGGENFIALNIFFLLLFCFFANISNPNEVIGLTFFVLLISLVLVFLFLYFDLKENTIEIVEDRSRATFGFANTNAFASLVYSFILTLLLFWKSSKFGIKYIFLIAISTWTYAVTDNRSIVVSVVIFIFIRLFFIIFNEKRKVQIFAAIMLFLPIVMTQLSPVIVQQYPLLDILLSFRPSFSASYMSNLPWYSYIIGGVSPSEFSTIDNAFLLIQGALGIPFLIFLTLKIYKLVIQLFCQRMLDMCAVVISFWFYSFSESNLIRPETIFALLFWVLAFSKFQINKVKK